jgi:hypothetical protein
MFHSKKTALSLMLLFILPGTSFAASVFINFESFSLGGKSTGTVLGTIDGLQVSIAQGNAGNPRNGGTILDNGDIDIGGGFDGHYLTSNLVDNNGRVDLEFSVPIVGTISFWADYADSGTIDFQVVALSLTADPVQICSENDDGATKFIECSIATPTTTLRFRDNTGNPVQIDNLTVNTVPIPPAAWLFGSALGLLGWMRRKTG